MIMYLGYSLNHPILPRCGRYIHYFLLSGVFLLTNQLAFNAYAVECNPLITPTKHTTQYKPRDNRCEGIYSKKKVAGSSLSLIGFVHGRFKYALKSNEVIELSLPATSPAAYQQVKVFAKPVSSLTYYLMNAELQKGKQLRWPVSDVLLPEEITSRQLRAYASYTLEKDDSKTEVILPLRVSSSLTQKSNDNNLRLYLRSIEDIDYIKHNWRCADKQQDQVKKKQDFFAGKPILIFPPKHLKGHCTVDIYAVLKHRDAGGKSNVMHEPLVVYLAR